jgi:hypothetical protein
MLLYTRVKKIISYSSFCGFWFDPSSWPLATHSTHRRPGLASSPTQLEDRHPTSTISIRLSDFRPQQREKGACKLLKWYHSSIHSLIVTKDQWGDETIECTVSC